MYSQTELENLIIKYQKAYYDGNELISDSEFDLLWDELKERFPNSAILTKVGEDTVKGTKLKHLMVVGSQDKFNTVEGLHKWLKNEKIEWPILMEPKYDGNGVGVIYENGSLKYAITRGNGYEGEDITTAAIKSNKFPLFGVLFTPKEKGAQPIPFNGEVRGEVIIARDTFDEKYSEFKNPRNFTAGALKNEEFGHYEDFDFFMYDVVSTDGDFNSEKSKLNFLMENKFETTLMRPAYDVEDILEYRNEINPKYYPFNIDGIVLKQNSIDPADAKEMRPKKQKAFKWKDEGETTILKDVEWTLSGRTMTPVAIMEPVEIDGSTVKRANLCNPNLIKELGIKIGDEVEVVKRGMIIPKVERVVNTFEDSKEIEIPTVCPECGAPLINDGTRLYCSNENCKSVLLHRIDKWIRTLDVKGFGPALQKFAVESGWVKSIYDLYSPAVQLFLEESWGVNAEKAIASLLSKTNLPIAKIMGGFDMEGIGTDIIQTLVDAGYSTFDDLCNITEDQIIKLNGWSNIRANMYLTALEPLKEEIRKVMGVVGVAKEEKVEVNSTGISGLRICVTGKLNHYSRKEIEQVIKEAGASMDSSVTSKTDYLCTNDTSSGSSKLKNAAKYGTKIITEEQLKEMIEG